MINFRNREEIVPSGLILLAIALLSGALLYMIFVPPPSMAGVSRGRDRSRRAIETEIERTRARGREAEQAAAQRLWSGAPDGVTAAVLARLTREANRRSLKLGAFRPQRPQALEELTELPFSVQVSGPFPAVQSFLATLDRPDTRLVIRSLQVASSDAASNAVTATLGLSAYLPGGTEAIRG